MVKIATIRKMAKGLNIPDPATKRTALIRQIQSYEGNLRCFKEKQECGEAACLWREECLSKKA